MSNKFENELLEDEKREEQSENIALDLYLTFCIEDEEYAINVAEVSDIQPNSHVTAVPKTPHYLKGIINVRGDIIPVICVRSKFMKPEKEYDELTCIIQVKYEEYSLGLIVDSVKGVEKITPENISSPPNVKLNYQNQFIKNIGKTETGIKMILNLERLIF